MSSTHESYIEKYLIPELVGKFENEKLISFKVEHASGLDGFMSLLYSIQLSTKTVEGIKDRSLIAKFMRGDKTFRDSNKSYLQCGNEIHVYAAILPEFQKLLDQLEITSLNVEDLVPKCYKAEIGYIEGLSASPTDKDAVLVLENLKSEGYVLGPRLHLDLALLRTMCKSLGQYHALSYGLRALNKPSLERLKADIQVLHFANDNDTDDVKTNVFRVLYRLGFDRFFDFFERKIDTNTFDKNSSTDSRLIECLKKFREKYGDEPARLQEKFKTQVEETEEDRNFAAILHGDYSRNNVLFKYEDLDKTVVSGLKMFDFQLMGYGSPATDLSYFMYFNTTHDIRSAHWLDLLQCYHIHMWQTLSLILKASLMPAKEIDDILSMFSFSNFISHFKRFAFSGAMVCLHFLPWMLCSEEECKQISHLFSSNLFGDDFRKICLEAGGDEVNLRILEVIRHACEMGYMEDL